MASGQNLSKEVPLLTLSVEAQILLSTLLNPLKVIPTETNLPRDWRGVAELSSVPSETMALLETKQDPFKELLIYWSGRGGLQAHGEGDRAICVDDLKAFLGVIDRFDILEDVEPILERDKETYLSKISEVQLDRKVDVLDAREDTNILTFEDAVRAQSGHPLCRYDAFILYSEEDSTFADDVIRRLEGEYGLKICAKDRDLLPGLKFEHEIIGKMIESRCNRLLVIFSPSFLQSPANQFLVSYAQAVALDTRSRKIIPCVYKKCELPPSVRFSFCIDFNRSGKLWNFWEKLSQSLIVARTQANTQPQQTIDENLKTDKGSDKMHKTDSYDWWDATKSSDSGPTSLTNGDVEHAATANCPNQVLEDGMDTMSISSNANLLPRSSSMETNKPSKWFNKLMKPMRKKKEKEKLKPLAE